MDQGEAPDNGGSRLVRSMIKVVTGSGFTTPKESPRESPSFDQLLDAETSGRVNAGEVDELTDARTKGDVDRMDSRSPIASFTRELVRKDG